MLENGYFFFLVHSQLSLVKTSKINTIINFTMHFSLNITVHWIVSVQVVKFNLKCFVPKAKCDQDLLKRGTVYKKKYI